VASNYVGRIWCTLPPPRKKGGSKCAPQFGPRFSTKTGFSVFAAARTRRRAELGVQKHRTGVVFRPHAALWGCLSATKTLHRRGVSCCLGATKTLQGRSVSAMGAFSGCLGATVPQMLDRYRKTGCSMRVPRQHNWDWVWRSRQCRRAYGQQPCNIHYTQETYKLTCMTPLLGGKSVCFWWVPRQKSGFKIGGSEQASRPCFLWLVNTNMLQKWNTSWLHQASSFW